MNLHQVHDGGDGSADGQEARELVSRSAVNGGGNLLNLRVN